MQIERHIPEIDPIIVFTAFDFRIAASTMMLFVVLILAILFSIYVKRKFSVKKPSKSQVMFELIYDGIFDLLNNITGENKKTRAIFPVVGTLMLYLLVINLIELVPGLTSFEYNHHHLFDAPPGDFNTTFGLALGSVVLINILAVKNLGLFGYLGKFFKFKGIYHGFKKGITEGLVSIVEFLVGLMDIVGEAVKVISLSLRLFGNIFAGKVLTIVIFGIFSFVVPAAWYGWNIFVGVLQAAVFASLVTAYYTLAITPEESEGDG